MKVRIENILNFSLEDKMMIREWRNSLFISSKFQIAHISEDTHKNWLKSMEEKNPRNIAFFIIADDEKIGINYLHSIDMKHLTAEAGIFMDPSKVEKYSGVGLISSYLMLNYAYDQLGIEKINTEVLEDNKKALRFNKSLGLQLEGIRRGSILKEALNGEGFNRLDVHLLGMFKNEWYEKRNYIKELVKDYL